MNVKKTKETYLITDPPDSKVQLNIDFKENNFEVMRMHVETGSTIVEFAEEMAVEALKKNQV